MPSGCFRGGYRRPWSSRRRVPAAGRLRPAAWPSPSGHPPPRTGGHQSCKPAAAALRILQREDSQMIGHATEDFIDTPVNQRGRSVVLVAGQDVARLDAFDIPGAVLELGQDRNAAGAGLACEARPAAVESQATIFIQMSRPDPHDGKSGGHGALGTFSPFDLSPRGSIQALGQCLDSHGLVVRVTAKQFGRLAAFACSRTRGERSTSGGPHRDGGSNAEDVGKPPQGKPISEFGSIAITRIPQERGSGNVVCDQAVDQGESYLPFSHKIKN